MKHQGSQKIEEIFSQGSNIPLSKAFYNARYNDDGTFQKNNCVLKI